MCIITQVQGNWTSYKNIWINLRTTKKNKGNILLNSTNQEDKCVKIFAQARHILVHHERFLFFHADFVFDLNGGRFKQEGSQYLSSLSFGTDHQVVYVYSFRRVSVLEYNNPNGNFLLVRGLVLNKRVRVLFMQLFFLYNFLMIKGEQRFS